jgi:hypothetical protein
MKLLPGAFEVRSDESKVDKAGNRNRPLGTETKINKKFWPLFFWKNFSYEVNYVNIAFKRPNFAFNKTKFVLF